MPDLPEQAARPPTLVIRTDKPMAGAADTPPAPLEATAPVLAAEPLTPSIRRLVLALPPEVRLRYRAGMHVELGRPGSRGPGPTRSRPRPTARACRPTACSSSSSRATRAARRAAGCTAPTGSAARSQLHGPYGTFGLPEGAARPLLCLAGGSGLAPILAILRQALAGGLRARRSG